MVALPGRAAAAEIVESRAARLVDRRPRVDRPSSASSAGSTTRTHGPSRFHLTRHEVMAPCPQAIPATSDVGMPVAVAVSIDLAAKMARVPPRHFACAVASGRPRSFGCRRCHQPSFGERFAVQLRRPNGYVDSSTAGAARRPRRLLRAAWPRLVELRPRAVGLRQLKRRVRRRERTCRGDSTSCASGDGALTPGDPGNK